MIHNGGTWQNTNKSYGGGVTRGNHKHATTVRGREWVRNKGRENCHGPGHSPGKPKLDADMYQDLMAAKETAAGGRKGISTTELKNIVSKHIGDTGRLDRDQQFTLRQMHKRASVGRRRGGPDNPTWNSVRARKLALHLGWGKPLDARVAAEIGLQPR